MWQWKIVHNTHVVICRGHSISGSVYRLGENIPQFLSEWNLVDWFFSEDSVSTIFMFNHHVPNQQMP